MNEVDNARWSAGGGPMDGSTVTLLTPPEPMAESAVTAAIGASASGEYDLSMNVAGATARERHRIVDEQAPLRNAVARLVNARTHERELRLDAAGQELVGHRLELLGPDWRVLHSIAVGARGNDINHLVIGPRGAFTLHTRPYPRAVVVAEQRCIRADGEHTDDVRNARDEGILATRLLSSACGFDVTVQATVVLVFANRLVVRQQSRDVHVTTRHRLIDWLDSRPDILSANEVGTIYDAARRVDTWYPTLAPR